MICEVISYSVSTLYNFTNNYRWTNYFEYVILIVQDYILIAIVLFYRREFSRNNAAIVVCYALVMAIFGFSFLPKNILTLLIVSWHRPSRKFSPLKAIILLIFSLSRCQCQQHQRFFNSLKLLNLKIRARSVPSLGLYLLLQI